MLAKVITTDWDTQKQNTNTVWARVSKIHHHFLVKSDEVRKTVAAKTSVQSIPWYFTGKAPKAKNRNFEEVPV
jgi:hypothetical protein